MTNDDFEVEKVWEEFWKPILVKDGKLNFDQLKKELYDYNFMLEQVPIVYCHVTGGLLSKPFYHADTVIEKADEYYDDLCRKYSEEI